MNIKAGLTRAWLVGSLAWVIYCTWQSDLACPLASIGVNTPGAPWCGFENAEPLTYYGGLALRMIAVPIAAWLVGAVGYWIAAGFRRPSRAGSRAMNL
jgi:hypothetical protein